MSATPRRCTGCQQPAEGHRCANDYGLVPTHYPLTWHDHEYDEWYCQPCAADHGDELLQDARMHDVD